METHGPVAMNAAIWFTILSPVIMLAESDFWAHGSSSDDSPKRGSRKSSGRALAIK